MVGKVVEGDFHVRELARLLVLLNNTIHTHSLFHCWLQSAKLFLLQFKRSSVKSCKFCICYKSVFVAEQCFIMGTVYFFDCLSTIHAIWGGANTLSLFSYLYACQSIVEISLCNKEFSQFELLTDHSKSPASPNSEACLV